MTTISRCCRFVLAAVAGLIPFAATPPARASGFLTDQFGSDHGQPALANPYAVYFNPAAMAGMHGSELAVDVVAAARSLDYDRTGLSPSDPSSAQASNPTYQQSNLGQARLFNVLGAPFLGFVTDFGGSSLRLGVASYIPFGGQVSWQKDSAYGQSTTAPGAYDGPQRWQAISTSTYSMYETAALAYRFERARIGLGASVSLIRTGVTDVRARNADGSDDTLTANGMLKEGRSYLDVNGLQAGAAAGIYWEPLRDGTLRLGASYTSQPGFGTMRLKGSFSLQPGATSAGSTSSVDLLQAYPDIIRAGAAWRLAPEAELRLDVSWQRWSQFKSQCIVPEGEACPVSSSGVTSSPNASLNLPRDWHDTAKVRLGGAYWVTPRSEVFGSFAFEPSPVGKSHEDALVFDSTRLYWTLGVTHQFTRHLSGSLSYSYVYMLPVTVTDSAYPTYTGNNVSPSANGQYSSELYLLDAAVSYRF
jgi:long-chain fatty acid transport protein